MNTVKKTQNNLKNSGQQKATISHQKSSGELPSTVKTIYRSKNAYLPTP